MDRQKRTKIIGQNNDHTKQGLNIRPNKTFQRSFILSRTIYIYGKTISNAS